jgi:hypothetical protein
LSDLSLSRLKPGYVLDYDLKTWQVTAHNRYDYDGDWADEWELTCADDVLFLEREVDDDETWAVYRKIELSEIQEDVRAAIMEDDDPPNHVTAGGVTYEAESSDSGYFHRGGEKATGGSGKEFVNWSYADASEKKLLVIEQWGENDFAASVGEIVAPFQFSDILPGKQ